jgi:predicted RNA binding protein YcfA (HicA-like mRNA interferase family)
VSILGSLPVVNGKDLVNYLCRNGYYIKRIHGSHHFCVHKDGTGTPLDVPVHSNKNIAKGTLCFIITVFARNEGVTEDEAKEMFRRL